MSIRGGLSEFSVPELFQLLALQQKTGVLTLNHAQGHTQVLFFERGRILAAADRRENERHEFVQFLADNQVLHKDQIESVEDICKGTGHDLFTVLLTSGVMSRERLTDEMKRFTQRRIDQIANWKSGTYDFSQGDEKSLPNQGLNLKLNPEELVLESMRREDELSTMKESMLAPDLILAKVENAPAQPLPRESSVLLSYIDGERSLDESCRVCPLGEYLTYEAITELLGRQLIMIVDPNEQRHTTKHKVEVGVSVPTVVAVAALAFGSLLFGAGLKPLVAKTGEPGSWFPREVEMRQNAVRAQLQQDADALRETVPDKAEGGAPRDLNEP